MENLNFEFTCPTKIYFYVDGVDKIGEIIRLDYDFKRVFLVYGSSSIKKNHCYEKVINSLKENKIVFEEYSGISSNPDISDVNKMIEVCRKFKPELILAIGGGSVIDSAKLLSHGYYYLGDPLDFNKNLVKPIHALPVATILTIAASGSEMSSSCVISDRKHNFKSGFNSVTNYPLFSLMDPTLTYTVPPYQVGIGLADMFSHAMERYFSPSNEIEPCDDMALGLMRSIVNLSSMVILNPNDLLARRSMMIASTLAHNGILNYGKKRVFIVHKAEHRLSGKYPLLLHGQGIALLLTRYLTINQVKFEEKLKKFGIYVFDLDKDLTSSDAINALDNYIKTLPIYHSFNELPFSIDEKDILKADEILTIENK